MQGRAFLVVAVYVASLVLVAFGHCAPTFGLAPFVQAEHTHSHDSGDHHEHSGSAEDCAADVVAKGCFAGRVGVIDASSAKSVAVLPAIEVWRKTVPLVALTPERPPDTVPRARSGYAQTLARTGRLIV